MDHRAQPRTVNPGVVEPAAQEGVIFWAKESRSKADYTARERVQTGHLEDRGEFSKMQPKRIVLLKYKGPVRYVTNSSVPNENVYL